MNDEMERGRLIGLAQARGYRNPEKWADHVIQSRERKAAPKDDPPRTATAAPMTHGEACSAILWDLAWRSRVHVTVYAGPDASGQVVTDIVDVRDRYLLDLWRAVALACRIDVTLNLPGPFADPDKPVVTETASPMVRT